VDNNGGLSGITRDREFNVQAWHQHKIGGALSGEDPKVLSITTVPSSDNTHDEVWITVKRTINAGDKIYIEKMGKQFDIDKLFNSSTNIKDKMVYSDSAKFVRLGAPGKTFSGFDHLEGQTVDVVADGSFIGTKVVASGDIVLDDDKREIIAGLNFISRVDPLALEAGSIIGTAQSTILRVDQASIRFDRTIGGKLGPSTTNLQEIVFRPASLPMDQPIPLFTGDKVIKFDGSYSREARVIVQQNLPLPMTVVSIISRGVTSDG